MRIGLGRILGGCLAPVLVNAILELDDGKVAHFQGERFVQIHRLRRVSVYQDTYMPWAVCT